MSLLQQNYIQYIQESMPLVFIVWLSLRVNIFNFFVIFVQHAHIPGRDIVATWSDQNKVYIMDVSNQIVSVDNSTGSNQARDTRPLHTFTGHLVSITCYFCNLQLS